MAESELNALTLQFYNELKTGPSTSASANGASTAVIPRFWEAMTVEEEGLGQKLREEARSQFLQAQSKELLNNDELKMIWEALEKNSTPPPVGEERMIGYDDFIKVQQAAPTKAREFFRASTFGSLQERDPYGRISILVFFNYLMRKTWLRQSRIGLSLYDVTGQGYLMEKDVELYISELMPTMPSLSRLEPGFHSFYVCTAVRRFFFHLDPKRLGRIRIVDVLASGFLDDLLELRDSQTDGQTPRSPHSPDSADLAAVAKLDSNWFSSPNALRVYGQYLNLDSDRNGMLSAAELREYGGGSLTETFVQRVFQECLTYEGEMDYKAYLDFVLAMENKKDRASLAYFFRLLDIRRKGYLDAFAINFFFRDIQRQLAVEEQPMVEFQDIKDEIFDMVKPADPLRIKLDDLIACKQGDIVVNVLTDLDGFWKYENREYLANEQDDDDD